MNNSAVSLLYNYVHVQSHTHIHAHRDTQTHSPSLRQVSQAYVWILPKKGVASLHKQVQAIEKGEKTIPLTLNFLALRGR